MAVYVLSPRYKNQPSKCRIIAIVESVACSPNFATALFGVDREVCAELHDGSGGFALQAPPKQNVWRVFARYEPPFGTNFYHCGCFETIGYDCAESFKDGLQSCASRISNWTIVQLAIQSLDFNAVLANKIALADQLKSSAVMDASNLRVYEGYIPYSFSYDQKLLQDASIDNADAVYDRNLKRKAAMIEDFDEDLKNKAKLNEHYDKQLAKKAKIINENNEELKTQDKLLRKFDKELNRVSAELYSLQGRKHDAMVKEVEVPEQSTRIIGLVLENVVDKLVTRGMAGKHKVSAIPSLRSRPVFGGVGMGTTRVPSYAAPLNSLLMPSTQANICVHSNGSNQSVYFDEFHSHHSQTVVPSFPGEHSLDAGFQLESNDSDWDVPWTPSFTPFDDIAVSDKSDEAWLANIDDSHHSVGEQYP